MSDDEPSFVSIGSLKRPTRTPQEALTEIRNIYFKTSRETIQHDLLHAVALLKALATEEEREKASVYMEGLAQMRSDWARAGARKKRGAKRNPGR
jgi:hypothetical protein